MKNKSSVHTVEKSEIYSHRKKIRQINYLSFSLVNTLVSRIFGQNRVRVNFRNCHALGVEKRDMLFRHFSRGIN